MKFGLNPKLAIVRIVYVLVMLDGAMNGTFLNKIRRTISEELGINPVEQDIHSDQSMWMQSIEYQKSLAGFARDSVISA
ncbi:hypothetical protein ACFTRD_21435 [Paenibacillus sp. NPDC056933]|uniref:hypothetical protein n=1 Tax=Paenibacillus sp. NPDC056933 TaxID=3345968 RepID=UPI0036302C92